MVGKNKLFSAWTVDMEGIVVRRWKMVKIMNYVMLDSEQQKPALVFGVMIE